MKSKVNLKENKPFAVFPALYRVHATGTIVLMTNECTGTVVHAGEGGAYKVGEYSEDWVIYNSPNGLQYMHGSITLSN